MVFDLHFTDRAVSALITQYMDTISFAKLVEGDKVSVTEQDEDPLGDKESKNKDIGTKPPPPVRPPMTGTIRYLPIPLDIGDATIPVGMSEDDYQL